MFIRVRARLCPFRDHVITDEAAEDLDGRVDRQGREHAELPHLGIAFRAIAHELVLNRRIRRNIRVVGCHNGQPFSESVAPLCHDNGSIGRSFNLRR